MPDADLFTPAGSSTGNAWVTVELGGRAELRMILIDGRVLIGRSWMGDVVVDAPAIMFPVEAVPDVVAALRELVGEG
jgi:hypothetical protein